MKTTGRTIRIGLIAMTTALATIMSAPGASAIGTWAWESDLTNVNGAHRGFSAHPADTETARQNAWELTVRHPKNGAPQGRAEAAQFTNFSAVMADRVVVNYFGRDAEARNVQPGRLVVYVSCENELQTDWVYISEADVIAFTGTQVLDAQITVEDCPTGYVDGIALQLRGGGQRDRRVRTVFLQKAELWKGGTSTWKEDFAA